MRTGLVIPDEPSLNIKTFLLAFMAIVWRRVWITTVIYCEHNRLKLSSDVVLKCLKFNIFSEAGIGNTIKPYIIKAFKDGFLMPQFYEKNIYASRAVKLYKKAFEIVKLKNEKLETEFIKEYALSIFDTDEKNVTEVAEETNDAVNNINNPTNDNSDSIDSTDNSSDNENIYFRTNEEFRTFSKIMELPEKCKCKMCEIVDSWDVNIELIYSEDPFRKVIMKGLSLALDGTDI